MYKIKDYSYEQAKKLNVEIKPSTVKNKKLMYLKMIRKQLVQDLKITLIIPLIQKKMVKNLQKNEGNYTKLDIRMIEMLKVQMVIMLIKFCGEMNKYIIVIYR